MNDYVLELPGDFHTFAVEDDLTAAHYANIYLNVRGITEKGLKLFRYPYGWLEGTPTKGLIEVPFYQLSQRSIDTPQRNLTIDEHRRNH